MNKKILQIIQYVLFLGIGIFLVWWQLKSMKPDEWKEFTGALKNIRLPILIPVFIMSLLSHLSRAMRWKILLEPLNYHPKLKNTFAAVMVGYLANAAVPRLGEVLKCTILARYEKLKADKLFGSIILERTFDFVCFLIFIAITILIQTELVGDYFSKNLQTIAGNNKQFTLINGLIALSAILLFFIFLRYIFKKFPGNKIFVKVRTFLNGIFAGFTAIRNLKQKKAFIAHTLFIWLMYMLQVYIGFQAMDSTAHLGIPAAFSVLTLATVAMIATPGGIGAFPIFVMQILAIYGISDTQGKAFGWLLWGVNTGIFVVAGVVSLIALPYMNRNTRQHP
jgi:uncharacterized protein (TIRG00374 family)